VYGYSKSSWTFHLFYIRFMKVMMKVMMIQIAVYPNVRSTMHFGPALVFC